MRVFTDQPLSLGWMVGKVHFPQLSATFIVKGTYSIAADARLTASDEPDVLSGDKYAQDDPAKSLLYPADFVPFKPRADVLLVGAAHSPQHKPVSTLDVTLRVGSIRKTLTI